MKKSLLALMVMVMGLGLVGCEGDIQDKEEAYTEQLMQQVNDEIGMPNITEFYEKKIAKEIFEKRDDSKLVCYVYNQNLEGQYVYIGRSMGYGLPYSTQFTAPSIDESVGNGGVKTKIQADPNGLYTADGLSATWLMMIDDKTGETYMMYCEPTIIVTENKLEKRLIAEWSLEGVDY